MDEKANKIRSFFSFRTSYFNTNLQAATGNVHPELLGDYDEDSVDNNKKGTRRRNANRNNSNNNQQQQNNEKSNGDNNNNSNSNANSTVVEVTTEVEMQEQDNTNQEIENTDVISDLLGHFGWWQFIWCLTLSLFQFPSTFHLFSFVFEVCMQIKWIFSTSGHLVVDKRGTDEK